MQTKGSSEIIRLDVSGSKFTASKWILSRHPDTRLGKLVKTAGSLNTTDFYFDRPPTPFEAILTYYQTGKLHLPPTVCPNIFKDELDFWEIDLENMEQCCLLNYNRFAEDCKTKAEFQKQIQQTLITTNITDKSLTTKQRIWRIIDFKERNWMAKLFLFTGICFVLLSVITLALSSLPENRRTLSLCEWSEYALSGREHDAYVTDFFRKHDCEKLKLLNGEGGNFDLYPEDNDDEEVGYDQEYGDLNEKGENTTANSPPPPKKKDNANTKIKAKLPTTTLKYDIFYKIDYIATAFFTVELLLRLCVCPCVLNYFKSVLNIIDTIVLVGTYIDIVIVNLKSEYKFSSELINFVDFLKLLRVVRLLRYCQHLAAVQVLKYSMRQNFKDLLVLLIHIMIILLIFADIIYLAEDHENIESIPQGWWLGLITLTTVGYGDYSPKSLAGKITCGVCALCGIMVLSLIIPIFVDTFVSLYSIAHIKGESRVKNDVHPPTKESETDLKMKECWTIKTQIK